MKRMLQFKQTEVGYACFEDEDNVFEISKTDLQFNVKDFYQAFYGEDKDFDDIELENCIEDDKDANRVYNCIITLMSKIKEKLAELSEETEESNGEQAEQFNCKQKDRQSNESFLELFRR